MKPPNSNLPGKLPKRQYALKKLADFSKRRVAVFAVVFGFIGGIVLLTNSAAVRQTPVIYLSPDTKTIAQSAEFLVEVRADSGSAMVNAVQANISYPADLVEFVGISATGSAFTTEAPSSGSNGNITIARGVIQAVSGDQLVATIKFKSKAVNGAAKLAFTADTALLDSTTNIDILGSLDKAVGALYQIGSGGTPTPPPTGSAKAYLSPASKAVAANTTFSVEVRVDSGDKTVNAVQANLSYPADLIDFVSIDATGTAFTTEAPSSGGGGKVSIARGVIQAVSGDKLVAIVNFKTKTATGTAAITFVTDTALIDATNNVDILGSLSATKGGSYQIGGSGGTNPNPNPTPPNPNPTPTPPNPAPGNAKLFLNPSTSTIAPSTAFSVEIRSNSGGTTVNAVQANLSYPASLVDFVGIDASGSAFTTEAPSTGGNGVVSIARGVIGGVSGEKLVAKVNFKSKATSGIATMSFVADSALLDSTSNLDILGSLNATAGGTYTIGSGGVTNPNPPTSAPKRGDIDGNGKVDFADLAAFLLRWGTNDSKADFDGDGKVTIFDLSILLSDYGA